MKRRWPRRSILFDGFWIIFGIICEKNNINLTPLVQVSRNLTESEDNSCLEFGTTCAEIKGVLKLPQPVAKIDGLNPPRVVAQIP